MRNRRTSSLICLLFLLFFLGSCGEVHSSDKKEMKASEIIKLLDKGKPVQLYDKIILDDLDFTSVGSEYITSIATLQKPVESNIAFFNCVFMGDVKAIGYTNDKVRLKKNVRFGRNVTFFMCDFRKDLNFEDITVMGQLDFTQSVFRGKTSFNEMTVFGDRNSFSGITAEGKFTMISALVHGNLNFMDAVFKEITSFQGISVGLMQFGNITFEKNVDFSNLIVYKNAFFNYVTFKENALFPFSKYFGNVDFMNSKVEKGIDFTETTFYGKTRLNQTEFDGDADFTKTLFLRSPQTDDVKSEKPLEINK